MYKGIMFDLDDTLIDEADFAESGFRVISRCLSSRMSKPDDDIYRRLRSLSQVSTERVFNRFLEECGFPSTDADVMDLVRVYRQHVPDIRMRDDAIELVARLKEDGRFKLGIITDGYAVTQRNKIMVLGLDKRFDCIIVTDEMGREFWKPSKEPYIKCCETLGLGFAECVYVGDNASKDFIGAKELGVFTIQVRRRTGVYSGVQQDAAHSADMVVTSLVDVWQFLNGPTVDV